MTATSETAPPSEVAGPAGTVFLRYGSADGTPATWDMSLPDRGLGSNG
ncbi:hypothetical protein OG361_40415 [Streptomyces sp. NBC_00090]